ncbi:MAG: glycoside hydrolase family 2 TIM barrel-domain containing protein [Terrisporobacter sp.]
MNKRIYLNDNWRFLKSFKKEMCEINYDESNLDIVRLPHANVEIPYNYFDENSYEMISGYRKKLHIDELWKDKNMLLTFEGIAHVAKVYINNILVSTHKCGYTAFTINISPYVDFGCENILTVEVNSKEDLNIPPFGNVIDYLTYGGIYREAYLDIKEKYYIEDVFVVSENVLEEKKKIKTEIKIKNYKEKIFIRQSLIKENKVITLNEEEIKDKMSAYEFEVDNIDLWDIDNPNLYYLCTQLIYDEKVIDEKNTRFGFREVRFENDGFYLNGRKVKIRGLNRHQAYPYVGYAMPKSPQIKDAEILKNELKLNAVRTSHYPQSQHFIDRCDEIGLLVFTEMPGWQHIGDDEWKKVALKNIEEMVLQYRNHPSIIIWGVRINESPDDNNFYKEANEVSHKFDYSRATGGVRCIKNSTLFEDVYTYNDFVHDGKTHGLDPKKDVTSNMKAPYMVTEYNGHMFPTKSFDSGEHVAEHALRHTKVLNSLYEHEDIIGGFGWCMFDYNTHKDFGSGDRICYHGVMDMFRNEKLASTIYKCQQDEEPVLEISASMDIGEHPASLRGDVYAYSNMDFIRLYKNNEFIKEYNTKDTLFKYLDHGPILIDDLVGNNLETKEGYSKEKSDDIKKILSASCKYGPNHLPTEILTLAGKLMVEENISMDEIIGLYNRYIGNWGDKITTYRFEGIKDDKVVKVVEKKPGISVNLKVDVDKNDLIEENTYDVASIRIKAVDENGNLLRFYQEPLLLEVEGNIELIGPKLLPLRGGMSGTYIKTVGKQGEGTLKIHSDRCETIIINFKIL